MPGDRRPDGGARAGDDVDDAVREPGLLHEPAEVQHRGARDRGRLHDQRVAARQRGRAPARHQLQRAVPGDGLADHAERLPHRVHEPVVRQRRRRPLDLSGEPGEVLEMARRRGDLEATLADRDARVAGLQLGQDVDTLPEEGGQPAEEPPLVMAGHPSPRAFAECRPRRPDRVGHVVERRGLQPEQHLVRRRVEDVDRPGAAALAPLAVNEHLLGIARQGKMHRPIPLLGYRTERARTRSDSGPPQSRSSAATASRRSLASTARMTSLAISSYQRATSSG